MFDASARILADKNVIWKENQIALLTAFNTTMAIRYYKLSVANKKFSCVIFVPSGLVNLLISIVFIAVSRT